MVRSIALATIVASFALLPGCGNDDPLPSTTTTVTTETAGDGTESLPDPKLLVARLAALPSGYRIETDQTGPRSLADALDNTTPEQAALIREQRVAGWGVRFKSRRLHLTTCSATVYRSSEGAGRLFQLAVQRAPALAEKNGGKLVRLRVPVALGNETVVFRGEFEAPVYTVVWRTRNVLSVCSTAARTPPPASETLAIARAQQRRIRAALS